MGTVEGTGAGRAPKRKLIEVALPLETINRESAREKSIRHGHPSTLHLWWSRKPLATARAVLFAQLVDDPSSDPDRFPTEEAQQAERERLHRLIERLVVWENTRDQALLNEAHAEILASTGGNPPPILDPFAGGGTIPLEAQRLGLEAHASDLNPVAVLINKALIEIPPKFAGWPPIFPGLADQRTTWEGATGLAADVRAYGEWMRNEAERRIGQHYPKATLEDGSEATVIAWIWARTVTCPNPACGIEMPLVSNWWLSNKSGKSAWIRPIVVSDDEHESGRRVEFEVARGPNGPGLDPTMSGRSGGVCVACGTAVEKAHVKREGKAGRLGTVLMATVAEGGRGRTYVAPTSSAISAARIDRPQDAPDDELGHDPRAMGTPLYGLSHFSDLFSDRQLTAMVTCSDLVNEIRTRASNDFISTGEKVGVHPATQGSGAEAYADAIATYLGLMVSRCADYYSTLNTWAHQGEFVRNVFARQALPMTWTFAEVNPFSDSTGNLRAQLAWVTNALERLPASTRGTADQTDAQSASLAGAVLSTDPPYYDNINYSNLSDYFYVWQRRTLRETYPSLLGTVLVPKAEELVANPYRHEGKSGAKAFFEEGFRQVFATAREFAPKDYPITVYYAFKQSDVGKDGESSSGWETLLEGMIQSSWAVTATWPMRSERASRMRSIGTNALASSIVLALRPRPAEAQTEDRRGFVAALKAELPAALRRLQHGAIAPVDLPQAAIGPGMAVFTRYARVIEADGSDMTVRTALTRINETLDQVLNEQEGDFDQTTRFAIAWYRQYGYAAGVFGDADNIARARNTAVDAMARDGILDSVAGKVRLLAAAEMPADYDPLADDRISAWEVLHNLIAALERGGLPDAGALLARAEERPDAAIDTDLVKELAFLLFSIAEKNGWTGDALAFNTIATAWPDVTAASAKTDETVGSQATLDIGAED